MQVIFSRTLDYYIGVAITCLSCIHGIKTYCESIMHGAADLQSSYAVADR